MQIFSDEFQKKLTQKVESIEKNSHAEVVVVIKEISGTYTTSSLLGSIVFMIAVYTFLMFSPIEFNVYTIFFITVLSLFVGYAIFEFIPPLKRLFMGKQKLQKNVEIYARAIFQKAKIRLTKDRIGILIYISLYEKHVVILPDVGAEEAIPPGTLQQLIDDFNLIFDKKNIDEEILKMLDKTADVLSRCISQTDDDVNELPDNIDIEL